MNDAPDTASGPMSADWTAMPSRRAAGAVRRRPGPAECTCAHCGRTGPLAQHDLYPDSPALVLRCVGCAGVVLRYSSAGGRIRLDLSGTRLLVSPLPEQPAAEKDPADG